MYTVQVGTVCQYLGGLYHSRIRLDRELAVYLSQRGVSFKHAVLDRHGEQCCGAIKDGRSVRRHDVLPSPAFLGLGVWQGKANYNIVAGPGFGATRSQPSFYH